MLVLTLGTDRLMPLFEFREQDGSDAANIVKINRLFFMQDFVDQQTDLKQYSKSYWPPMKGMLWEAMKGMKQCNIASEWR